MVSESEILDEQIYLGKTYNIEEHFVPMPVFTSPTSKVSYNPTVIYFDSLLSERVKDSCDATPFLECLAGVGLHDPDATLFHEELEREQLAIRFVLKVSFNMFTPIRSR